MWQNILKHDAREINKKNVLEYIKKDTKEAKVVEMLYNKKQVYLNLLLDNLPNLMPCRFSFNINTGLKETRHKYVSTPFQVILLKRKIYTSR